MYVPQAAEAGKLLDRFDSVCVVGKTCPGPGQNTTVYCMSTFALAFGVPQAEEAGKLLDLSSLVWEDLQLRWYEINKVRAAVGGGRTGCLAGQAVGHLGPYHDLGQGLNAWV